MNQIMNHAEALVRSKWVLAGLALSLGACGGSDPGATSVATSAQMSHAPPVLLENQRRVARNKEAAPVWVGSGLAGTMAPSDFRVRYNMPAQLSGAGQTIALVTPPGGADVLTDLNQFSDFYNLPQCNDKNPCFEQVFLGAGVAPPTSDINWAYEVAQDVQWIHAIAPNAKILLVLAASTNLPDLMKAADYAASRGDVLSVSLNWSVPEFSDQTSISYDGVFKKHPGTIFFASAIDSGRADIQSYPAASNYVTSVGGTTVIDLGLATSKNEVPWSMSTTGASKYSIMPDFQKTLFASSVQSSQRQIPDVGYNADNNRSPVAMRYGGSWYASGGTGVAAAQWAAVSALMAESLQAKSKPSLSQLVVSSGGFNSLLYQARLKQSSQSMSFVNVATGLGVPNVSNLIASLQ